MTTLGRRLLVLAGIALVLTALGVPRRATAHPLGNFSISQYAAIRIERDAVTLRYLVDMAEIPTFQEIQETGVVADPRHATVAPYVRRKAEMLRSGLRLEVDGRPLSLAVVSADVIFPAGAGDLPTMKLGILYRAALPMPSSASSNEVLYRDRNFEGRAGWKEVIATAAPDVQIVKSSVPDRDRSRELADYPTDLLDSPPQTLDARVVFGRESGALPLAKAPPPGPSAGGPAPAPAGLPDDASRVVSPPGEGTTAPATPVESLALQPNTQSTSRNPFTDLITARQLGFGVVAMALAVAAALGALHALEPGHGKTVVAAYLVGSRGTAWHAFVLGLIVTASHTAGVYLLGAITFFASQYVVPERLYPWLGVASGLTIAGLGCVLFVRRYAGSVHSHAHGHHHGAGTTSSLTHHHHDHEPAHTHGHAHHHGHAHGHDDAHGHEHPHDGGTRDTGEGRAPRVTLRELFALGVTGGIVPCPAALVVLLSALSMRRIGFGMLLIVAFSVGLAAVLIAIGVLMVYARRLMSSYREDSALVTRWLPLASSAVITIIGVTIAVQALVAAGIVSIRLG